MYFVPGLSVIEKQLEFAREKYGVTILQYPHWAMIRALKTGVYCPNYYKFDDMPDFKVSDLWNVVMEDTGINLIAHGAKMDDGRWRRWNFSKVKNRNVIYPLKQWNKFDVLAYLKQSQIPIPDSSKRSATGIDLSTPSLLWLYDTNPDDFKKLCEVFPYAESVVKRCEWYGIK